MTTVDDAVILTSYSDVREALASPDLTRVDPTRDAYVAGNINERSVVGLHGGEHRERRRAEAPLFAGGAREEYEHRLFPRSLDRLIDELGEDRRFDLVTLARHAGIGLAARTAGIDFDASSPSERETLARLARVFAEAAAVEDSNRSVEVVMAELDVALAEYRERYFGSSLARRREAHASASPDRPRADLDVLSVLISDEGTAALDDDVLLQESAFFLAAGSDTSAQGSTNVVHESLRWCDRHPEWRSRLANEPGVMQLFVQETLRLRPIVPFVPRRAVRATVIGGVAVPEGTKVRLDLASASIDPAVFGSDATEFDPFRHLPRNVVRYGFAFGGGSHACLGKVLAAGSPAKGLGVRSEGQAFHGLVTVLAARLFAEGVRRDADAEPEADHLSRRGSPRWMVYPVVLDRR